MPSLALIYNVTLDRISGDCSPLGQLVARVQRGGKKRLRISFVNGSEPRPLASTEYARLIANLDTTPDADPPALNIQILPVALVSGTTATYEVDLNLRTDVLDALLGVDGDPSNDVAAVTLKANIIILQQAGDVEVANSETFDFKVINDWGRPDADTPVAQPGWKDRLFEALEAGANVTITQDPETKDITIAATGGTPPVVSVNGKTGAVTLVKADINLGNVNNTSDADKPVSAAQQAALDLKANASALTAHAGDTANPHHVTKAQVGLGNVSNTSDADKPVSAAQQAALDAKADLVDGKVPAAQLPSYVDDVIEAADAGGFPATGEFGKIYVAKDTGSVFRWTGSGYVEISATPAFATQAQAEAGTDNPTLMTPQRTAQAIAAQLPPPATQIVRGTGTLQGWTVAPVAATPPPALVITFAGADGVLSLHMVDNNPTTVDRLFTFGPSDPEDGSTWIDSTDFSGLTTSYAAALVDRLTTGGGMPDGFGVVNNSDGSVTISAVAGALSTLTGGVSTGALASLAGGGAAGSGSDGSSASGQVSLVTLLAGVVGKMLRLLDTGVVAFGVDAAGWSGTINLRYADGTQIASWSSPAGHLEIAGAGMDGAGFAAMTDGVISQGIVAEFIPASSIDTDYSGGSVRFGLIATLD